LFGCTQGCSFVNRRAALTSAANYDDVLRQLRAEGLLVDDLIIGKRQRCRVDGDREKRGWYSLHELVTGAGAVLIVGAYGVWRGPSPNTLKVELKREHADPLTTEQREALKARIKLERQAADAERRAEAARAAARADGVWRRCLPTGASDYLVRKRVQSHGLKFTDSGALVVPMLDVQGRVHGLQFILPAEHPRRKKTGRDKEYWPAGLAKRGHFFQIGAPPQLGGVILLAEGYATAATLHEATGLPVVVAFDAGNLVPVAQAIAGRYKRARILVCADDDYQAKCLACGKPTTLAADTCVHCGELHAQQNAGVASATAAAMAVDGAHLVPVFSTERAGAKLTDFNDLAALEGEHVVRAQLEAHLRHLKWPGQGKVVALHTTTGRGGGHGGEGGPPDDGESFHFDLDVLLQRFTLIYGTDTAFDEPRRCIIGLGPLRSAAGKSLVRMWLEHPGRRTVLPEQVGFDPAGTNDQVVCNLWGGWPTVPRKGECTALLRILEHLCSREDRPREVYQWVLKWTAYAIQHPGAKLQTALLIHGPEGTGKNTFFGAVRQAYGRYGFTFTQVELESQFNGIFSGKLFGIGNEVVSRAELYHQQGRMRNMITEGEWPINEKNLPARMEQNHCNMVFFSNRIDIAKLDPDDRRYCVIWTPEPADPSLYLEAKEELANGGTAALHWHLANEIDLAGFDEHSKPPMTRAKRELIGLGMDSTERFWREWSDPEGELHGLYMPCSSGQAYAAYQLFCRRLGVGKPAQHETLSTVLGKKPGLKIDRAKVRSAAGVTRVVRCVFLKGLHEPPDHYDGSKLEWMSACVEEFDKQLEQMQADGVLPYGQGASPKRKSDPITEEEVARYGG
jgi:putative DNA primase/helicase